MIVGKSTEGETMKTLPRRAGRALVAAAAAAGLLAAAGPARAQVQGQVQGRTQQGRAVSTWQNRSGLDPWGNGSAFGLPTYRPPSYLGTLPNGTPVINPWNQPTVTPPFPVIQALFAYQYTLLNAAAIWNPSLYQYYATGSAAGWANGGMQPGGFGPGIQPIQPANPGAQVGLTFRPGVQVEPGGFARLGPDLAVNRVTGTVLQPYAGVAYTNEGTFFRVAGTGTFTPWGAYMPGSGVFLNPFTGTAYNPQTGLILRP